MPKQQELNVKVVLKRSPADKANGIWINGKKLKLVKSVTVHGSAGEMPTISVELLPTYIELELSEPECRINSPAVKNE